MGEALGPRAVVESLVDCPYRRSSLLGQRGVGHVEKRTTAARVTQFDPARVDVRAVVAYGSVQRLLPLRREGDIARRRAMYAINEGNFVGRQGAHKIDSLVREERREGWTRET